MKLQVIIISLFIFSNAFAGRCGLKTSVCSVKYHSTYDGDTFYANVSKFHHLFKERLGIRLKYINTPELRGSSPAEKIRAKEAKMFTLQKLEKAKRINLYDCVRGKYFRLVCRVIADGEDIGCSLLKKGMAKRYLDKNNIGYCKLAK